MSVRSWPTSHSAFAIYAWAFPRIAGLSLKRASPALQLRQSRRTFPVTWQWSSRRRSHVSASAVRQMAHSWSYAVAMAS